MILAAAVSLQLVLVIAGVIAAFGAIIAALVSVYFVRDRRVTLLRQERDDEQRRREQIEEQHDALRATEHQLRAELRAEQAKHDITPLAVKLIDIAETLVRFGETETVILEKLKSLNGGLDRAANALGEASARLEISTKAIEFLAAQILTGDPELRRKAS